MTQMSGYCAQAMAGLELTSERNGDSTRIGVAGELDIATFGELEEELKRVEADEPDLLVLDLRQTNFIDSSGLRVLIAADSRARERGGKVQIVRGSKAVERVFGATGLDQRLDIVDDVPSS
jgi:anti-sigma B factor antagonist